MSEHIQRGIYDCTEALGKAANDSRLIGTRHATVAARLGRAASLMGEVTAILAGCETDLGECQQAARGFLNNVDGARMAVAQIGPEQSANSDIRALPGKLAELHERAEYFIREQNSFLYGQQMLVGAAAAFEDVLREDTQRFEGSAHAHSMAPAQIRRIQEQNADYLNGH